MIDARINCAIVRHLGDSTEETKARWKYLSALSEVRRQADRRSENRVVARTYVRLHQV